MYRLWWLFFSGDMNCTPDELFYQNFMWNVVWRTLLRHLLAIKGKHLILLLSFPSPILKQYAGVLNSECVVSNFHNFEGAATKLFAPMHDDVFKWKHFPRYWSFMRGIHRLPVNSPHKGQWCGALMFSLICAWINGWVNNREAGDLRRHRAHYDVIVMCCWFDNTTYIKSTGMSSGKTPVEKRTMLLHRKKSVSNYFAMWNVPNETNLLGHLFRHL